MTAANALVLAEAARGGLPPAFASAVSAARAVAPGGTVEALVLASGGDAREAAAEAARVDGVARALLAVHPGLERPSAEAAAPLLAEEARRRGALVAPVGSLAKNLLPRAAALLDVQPVTEVIEVLGPREFIRPLYAGNALARVRSRDEVLVATVRAASFEPAAAEGGSGEVEEIALEPPAGGARWIADEVKESGRPELTSARAVVSGGRGMRAGENFRLLEKVADRLGAAVGASRAAVDAGFVSNELQVGQTGKVVAPDLYLAVGISGAIQHLAGMKDSKVIAAINSDPEAPIFQVADYGLVADLFEALPALDEALAKAGLPGEE